MTTAFLSPTAIEEVRESIATTSGRYVNPSKVEGTIRFRFFGAGITGYEGWTETEDGKSRPVRWEVLPEGDDIPANIRLDEKSGKPQLKRFIAGVVYEYKLNKNGEILDDEGQFKIINITQKSIMDQLFKHIADPDYGDPSGYDLKLTRTGEKLKTEYTLATAPPKPVTKALAAAWEEEQGKISLAAFMAGEDPFLKAEA